MRSRFSVPRHEPWVLPGPLKLMLSKPLIGMVVLSCIAFSVACDGGTLVRDPRGNTEVSLVISDPATAPAQLAALIDFVSYRITCPASSLTPYDDSVDIAGNFESVGSANPAVWTLVTDLPLSLCTIALWVFYEDEIICSGSDMLPIVDDNDPLAPNKVNVVLQCSLSVNPPSGDVDIDGDYTFVHGNYCPQVFWLGALPTVVAPAVPAVTNIQTSSLDMDNTCGQNCDPQTCDFLTNPPVCTPGPDLGLVSTLVAPAGKGTFGDPNALDTTYTCDPLFPGPTEICVVVSDGDIDCDQTRCLTIVCPGLCDGVVCDDGNECTRDRCDPSTGLCSNDPAPDGIACSSCNSTCQAGICDINVPFTADFNASSMFIQANLQLGYSATLVNPYSGASSLVSGDFRVNFATYKGIGTADTLSGINVGEILTIQDPLVGPQTVCGVETIFAQNGLDVVFLADDFIVLIDMLVEGGTDADLLWVNAGNDIVRGNSGNDTIDGGPGDDIIEGGTGNDTITLWPGSGLDSISGGTDVDRVEINAVPSQIVITTAVNPAYEFDISYLGVPMAEIREVEFIVVRPDLNSVVGDVLVDVANCVGAVGDVCNLCGNNILNGGEECDDGNNVNGDGCAADCTAEY